MVRRVRGNQAVSELLKSLLQHQMKDLNSFRFHPMWAIETVFMAILIKRTVFLCGKGFSQSGIFEYHLLYHSENFLLMLLSSLSSTMIL